MLDPRLPGTLVEMRPRVSRRRPCSKPNPWMPLMVGLPKVSGGGAAAITGWTRADGTNSSATRLAIASLAAQDFRSTPVIHPPRRERWREASHRFPLPPRRVVAYCAVVTHHCPWCQRFFRCRWRKQVVDTTARGSVVSVRGPGPRPAAQPGFDELRGTRLHCADWSELIHGGP